MLIKDRECKYANGLLFKNHFCYLSSQHTPTYLHLFQTKSTYLADEETEAQKLTCSRWYPFSWLFDTQIKLWIKPKQVPLSTHYCGRSRGIQKWVSCDYSWRILLSMLLVKRHLVYPKVNKTSLVTMESVLTEDHQGHPEVTYSLRLAPEMSSFPEGPQGLEWSKDYLV